MRNTTPHESFHWKEGVWAEYYPVHHNCRCVSSESVWIWYTVNQDFSTSALWAFGAGLLKSSVGGYSAHFRMFNSITGFDPLDSSSNHPQMWQPKTSPDITRCSLGGKITLDWEPLPYGESHRVPDVLLFLRKIWQLCFRSLWESD